MTLKLWRNAVERANSVLLLCKLRHYTKHHSKATTITVESHLQHAHRCRHHPCACCAACIAVVRSSLTYTL